MNAYSDPRELAAKEALLQLDYNGDVPIYYENGISPWDNLEGDINTLRNQNKKKKAKNKSKKRKLKTIQTTRGFESDAAKPSEVLSNKGVATSNKTDERDLISIQNKRDIEIKSQINPYPKMIFKELLFNSQACLHDSEEELTECLVVNHYIDEKQAKFKKILK